MKTFICARVVISSKVFDLNDVSVQPPVKNDNSRKAQAKSHNGNNKSNRSNQQAEPVKPVAQTVDLLGLGNTCNC